ncbi:CocE/NonD family hydrolase [Gordonia sp. HY285]|uniref:CocE/NonD family hydrolase n=1 Tax=Gordonia liuliyuniae TaxID=2911517 RepID=A0ABS9IP60_9ACTN|nr:CocE/NonD family hydrolase [Gordonia liuliyuniae]MCF8587338.1 CocE/NonD family hydrolase [Gordonia liuliyuniae]MCF8608838.1 CocE/NonD family hydrolase [Gordonia liuliyuniae]
MRIGGLLGKIAVIGVTAATAATVLAPSSWAAPSHSAKVGGGVEQAYITDTRPGTALTLVASDGSTAGSGVSDRLGSLLVRHLSPGSYTWRGAGVSPRSVRVTAVDSPPPNPSLYRQKMHEGLNYIRMRDGVTLAATVRLPYGKKLSDGPFPTVVEYSGYQNAAPNDLVVGAVGDKVGAPDPQAPASSVIVGATLAPQMLGFATISLQMRGSGCSGGDFGLFDHVMAMDGYDAIETIGRQGWVKNNKVGMVGISFSGITQMYTAGTRPPHLAAIAPMSTTDDLYSTGRPGGIFNKGFAKSWLQERVDDAKPGPSGGQPWVKARIDGGDRVCAANQKLRLQTQDPFTLIDQNPLASAQVYQERSIPEWASKIDVPVFLSGAAQDEQTGPTWVDVLGDLKHNPKVWANIINGRHFDSLGPQILSRWAEFLQIFVAGEVPHTPPAMAPLGLAVYPAATNAPGQPIPPVRFADSPNLKTAKSRFITGTPRVRALFGNGAGSAGSGGLSSPWQKSFGSWPGDAGAERLYLSGHGKLSPTAGDGQVAFRPNPANRPLNTLPEASVDTAAAWATHPDYDWKQAPGRSGLGFISTPLTSDRLMLGDGSVTLRVKSTAPTTDLQVTLTEVSASGHETAIGTGVLRSSYRGDGATPDYTRSLPLSAGFNDMTIPIHPVMHSFAKGSRIRVMVSAPGGDLASWQFDTARTGGKVVDTIDLSRSFVTLPVVSHSGMPVKAACGSLRGQQCRVYHRAFNGG